MRFAVLILCLSLAVPTLSVGGPRRFKDVDHWASVWDDPGRDEWQMRLTVLGLLGIQKGDKVADLGAGTGFFAGKLAISVGAHGKLYAVDVEPKMIKYMKAREDIPQERVEYVLAKRDDPKLPEGELDLILVVNTWHHIEDRSSYLEKLDRSLDLEGRVTIIDFRKAELPVGPPPEEKLSRDDVVEEFRTAGWTLEAESVALPFQYFLTFVPPRDYPERPFARR